MKQKLALALFLSLLTGVIVTQARSLSDIPAAKEGLLRIVSLKFYRSLLISPVEGWIVVRGQLVNDHLVGTRVIHSELNGRYDDVALELANNLQVLNYTLSDKPTSSRAVLVHLLVYQIADGKMALSFAQFEETGGSQLRYSGAAWMAVLKGNKWTTIDPQQLTPHERRGPRTYTLAVETPGSLRTLEGNGKIPIAAMSLRGSGPSMMVTHTSAER